MTRSLSLFSSALIEPDEFIRFFIDSGGEITDESTIIGRISSRGSNVWLYNARKQLEGKFETAPAGVEEKLGAPPKARIDLQLSHDSDSGSIALKFSQQFARKWPTVAAVAAYSVLDSTTIDHRLHDPNILSILSPSIELVFAAEIDPSAAIHTFGGITFDAENTDLLESAKDAIKKLDGVHYDPQRDRIHGVLAAENAYLWIISDSAIGPPKIFSETSQDTLMTIAELHLGAQPLFSIRILLGYGTTQYTQRLALLFSKCLLQPKAGILIGIFELIIDAQDLGRMVESDHATLLV